MHQALTRRLRNDVDAASDWHSIVSSTFLDQRQSCATTPEESCKCGAELVGDRVEGGCKAGIHDLVELPDRLAQPGNRLPHILKLCLHKAMAFSHFGIF